MPQLPQRPAIAPRFRCVRARPGEWHLNSLGTYLVVQDEGNPGLLDVLLPLLDGAHELPGLLHELDGFDDIAVLRALKRLQAAGVLAENGARHPADEPEGRFANQLAFFDGLREGAGPRVAAMMPAGDPQAALRGAHAVVIGLGRLGSNVVRSLALMGVGRISMLDSGSIAPVDVYGGGWFSPDEVRAPRARSLATAVSRLDPTIRCEVLDAPADEPLRPLAALDAVGAVVAATDGFDGALYETINRLCHRRQIPWTSARLIACELQIGPSVFPGEGACFACLGLRRRAARDPGLETNGLPGGLVSASPNITLGAELLGLEALKLLSGVIPPATYGRLFTLNTLTFETTMHRILRVPRCPVCGPATPKPILWDHATSPSASKRRDPFA